MTDLCKPKAVTKTDPVADDSASESDSEEVLPVTVGADSLSTLSSESDGDETE